ILLELALIVLDRVHIFLKRGWVKRLQSQPPKEAQRRTSATIYQKRANQCFDKISNVLVLQLLVQLVLATFQKWLPGCGSVEGHQPVVSKAPWKCDNVLFQILF